MLVHVILTTLSALYVFSGLSVVASIGKPRPPVTPVLAVAVLIYSFIAVGLLTYVQLNA